MILLEEMDIVIPVRDGDDNESLRYCLRSIDQNMPHRNIIIAGYKPEWVQNVTYIATATLERNKYRRVAINILAGAKAHEISEWFHLWNDDMFAMDLIHELRPLHRGNLITEIAKGPRTAPQQHHSLMMTYNALKHAGIKTPLNYDLHTPMMFNTGGLLMLEPVLKTMRLDTAPIQLRSFYGNMHHIEGDEIADVKIHKKTVFEYQENFPVISTTAEAFNNGLAGEEIRSRFTNKSKYEV